MESCMIGMISIFLPDFLHVKMTNIESEEVRYLNSENCANYSSRQRFYT